MQNLIFKMVEKKRCPYCGKEILATAKKCKHCKKWLETNEDITVQRNVNVNDSSISERNNWHILIIAAIIGCVVGIIILLILNMNKTNSQRPDYYNYFSNLIDSTTDEAAMDSNTTKDSEVEDVRQLMYNSEYIKYSNARFCFSMVYPNCFTKGEEPQNGDGCAFTLKYGISFSVWGSYNDKDIYGEDIKDYYRKDDDRTKATYHIQKDNWYVISGHLNNDKVFYKKVVWMKDYTDRGTYVTFNLSFPQKFKKVLDNFINYEAKHFNPIYEGNFSHIDRKEEWVDPLENLQIEVQKQPNREDAQSGYTRDQQIALLLLMLAAASDFESESGGGQEYEYPCRSCGMTFTNSADLRSHENAIHDY